MKRSIISVLAIGFASFALCSCDKDKAPSSLKGKTIVINSSGWNIPMQFDTDTYTAEILGGKVKGYYTYSKKSSDVAELIYTDINDKWKTVIITFTTPSGGVVRGSDESGKFTIK